MREIKFRAWDKDRKKMYFDFEIVAGFNCIDVQVDKDTGIRLQFNSEVMIMQFTGLKDKNGKEIYEGDIVKMEDAYESPEYTIVNTNLIAKVIFDDQGWHIKYPYQNDKGFCVDAFGEECDNQPSNFEVIGNIYENPELFKEKK